MKIPNRRSVRVWPVSLSALLAMLSLLLQSCLPQVVQNREAAVVLRDVTVLDGTGAAPRPHQVVVLRGGRIAQVGPVGSVEVPAGAGVHELSGRYVIPGLVDLHVHFPAVPGVDEAVLERLLQFGVTTILNPGARPGAGVALRERLRGGEIPGPRMFTAGLAINAPPDAEPDALPDPYAAYVATEAAVRDEVRAQAAAGVDFIKIYRRLPPDLTAAAIDEAHRHGLPVVGHMGATTWGEAAGAGIDMLVHSGWGTPMDEVVNLEDPAAATDTEWYHAYADAPNGARFATLVAALVENHVVVVPTLSIHQASGLGVDAALLPEFRTELAPDADVPGWWGEGWRERHPQYDPDSDEEAEMMATVYVPGILNIVRAYSERGVRLGVGTDVGNPWMTPGAVYHHELGLYQEAGIPPLAILTMATRNGAEALGILDDVGTIESGKRADLVVLRADPSLDIRNTQEIELVFQAGSLVSELFFSRERGGSTSSKTKVPPTSNRLTGAPGI